MSLDVNGFTDEINGGDVIIHVDHDHRLLMLARKLPWDEMLKTILPDLNERLAQSRPLQRRVKRAVFLL